MENKIEMHELITGYKTIKEIIDLLIDRNEIKYQPSSDAPNNFNLVKKHFDNYGYFEVFNGGDHGFLGQKYNIRFRALHDYMHVKNNLTFSFVDEKQLSLLTQAKFSHIAWHELNKTAWECYVIRRILGAEIRGQIEYYELNKKYVDDQKDFILTYLKVA